MPRPPLLPLLPPLTLLPPLPLLPPPAAAAAFLLPILPLLPLLPPPPLLPRSSSHLQVPGVGIALHRHGSNACCHGLHAAAADAHSIG